MKKTTRYGLVSAATLLCQVFLSQAFFSQTFLSPAVQAQILQVNSTVEESDPLIADNLDHWLYLGIFLLVAAVLLVINQLSHGLERALIFAFVVSAIAIAIALIV